MSKKVKDYAGEEFVFERELNAPRELVFKAWTEPGHLANWWGPRGYTSPVCRWDAQPGKSIYVLMRGHGMEHPMGGEFREVTPPERLVFTAGALDDKGVTLFEFLHDVTFKEKNDKTTITVRSRVVKTSSDANKYIGGFEAGMGQSLERLAELVNDGQPLVIERSLNAPVEKVWQALIDKDEMGKWSFELEEFKAKPGFEFRFVVEHEGNTFDHRCRITEVIPQKKLAYTWRYEGHLGDSLVTFELFDEEGKTRLRLTHTGLETFPRTPAFLRKNFIRGWSNIVGLSLKNHVEGNTDDTSDRDIVTTRIVNAPRELVWRAMTEPQHVTQWWGPRGFSTTIEKLDFRVGGLWKQTMHGPDGANYLNEHVFQEIVKPERIVFSHGGHKEGGSSVRTVATWTFETVESNNTKVTIRMVFPTSAERDRVAREFGAVEGAKQTLERLSEFLPKMGPA